MKVVILAGGFGTRLAEYTSSIPKPMVFIGEKPIIWHIMNTYAKYGHKKFIIALGYKSQVVKDYFLNYKQLNSNLDINLKTGKVLYHSSNSSLDWEITLVDTGLNTMTGGRLKRLQNFISNESFLLTYGDGLSNVNINELIEFHKSHKRMITLTAVRPNARFGELEISEKNSVDSFVEKPQLKQGWVNGGFFVIEPEFLNLIKDDDTFLEREPLVNAYEKNELMAFKHYGFWQCMDNKRDKDLLEKLSLISPPPWLK